MGYAAFLMLALTLVWLIQGCTHDGAHAAEEELFGTVIAGGVSCALMRGNEGQHIALQGIAPHEITVGTKLGVRGLFIQRSTCMQGSRTFLVTRVLHSESAE